ncbi:hypothetical protein AB0C33_14990 [Nonomuraea sp. NPDC048881]|uniref:hypothetical protein n=1 Tax=Nonomuraea sp. NPDC048881 TaxID=3155030 RepID=UPI0033D9C4A6
MRLSYGRNRLKSVWVPLVGSLAAVLVVMGLGWAVWHLYFSPQVSRVDPAVLSELRAIGQVVGEDSIVGHQWENNYVEMNDLVIYLDGNAKEDVVTEAAHRLKQRGWHASRRESSEIWLESARWPYALVTVEQLEDTHMSSELREQVISTGLPMSNMAYIGVQP